MVVVLAVADYERLKNARRVSARPDALREALDVSACIRERRGGRPLTPSDEVITDTRRKRDDDVGRLR